VIAPRRVLAASSSVLLAAAAAGCTPPRRTSNQSGVVAVEIAPVSSGGETDRAEVVVGVSASLEIAETDRDWITERARATAAIGGNGNGVAGRLSLDVQGGLALWDGADHAFARAGLFGTLERDPVTGWSVVELPTLWLGYQHHGRDVTDTTHFDIGPRLSLALAGRAFAPAGTHDLVAAPSAGVGVLAMGELFAIEITVARYLERAPLDVVWGSACFAGFGALCVDVRYASGSFGGRDGSTTYVGVRIGVGLASGKTPPL
jgi:hypothetical protein